MVVKYVAYTWEGQKVEGVLEVDREEEARELLQQDNLIPYRLVRVRASRSLVQLMPALFPVKPKDYIEFTRGLGSLLRSGIPIRESLLILRNQTSSLGLKEVLRRIVQDIENGERFSDACARHPSVFSGFYLRMLRVGEAGGGMDQTMLKLAETLEKRKLARDKVKGALTYPAISLVVAIGVATILITYSLPSLVELLESYGGTMPANTRLLLAIGEFVSDYRFHLLFGLAGSLVAGYFYLRTRLGIRTRDRLLLKMPIVGRVIMENNLFSLTSTFSALLEAGIPSVEALRLSGDSLNNVVLRERLVLVVEEAERGARLGPAFQQHWPSPPLLSQGIITGETSGNLLNTLHGLADYYEYEAGKSVAGMTELIQPAVILIVSLLVGFVATSVITGIYSSLQSIE